MDRSLNTNLSGRAFRALLFGLCVGIALGACQLMLGPKSHFINVPNDSVALGVCSVLYGVFTRSGLTTFLAIVAGVGGFFLGLVGSLVLILPLAFRAG